MAAKAGRLQIQLELEVQQLRRDLAKVNDELKRSANAWAQTLGEFKRGLASAFTAGAAVAAIGGVTSAITGMLDEMGRIQDESAKIRDTAENFQRLEFMANQSGVAMEAVVASAGKLQKQLGEIQMGGGKQAADALRLLGIEAEKLKGIGTTEAFIKVGGALGEVEDSAQQAAIGAALFGKGWQTMLPLILQGEEAMRASADAARVMTNEVVAAGDQFGDSMAAMKQASMVLLSQGIGPLLVPLNNVATYLLTVDKNAEESAGGFNIFTEALKHAIVLVADVVAGFRLVSAVFTNFGQTLGTIAIAAVEGFNLISQAAQDAFNPAKVVSGEAFENMKKNAASMVEAVNRSLAESQAEFKKSSQAAIDSLSNITFAVQQTKAAAAAPAPTGGMTQEQVAAMLKQMEEEAKAAAAAKAAALAQEKEARDATTAAIKAQAEAQRELQAEIDKEAAQIAAVTAAELDVLATKKLLAGATEEEVRLWRLDAEGADAHKRALSGLNAEQDALAEKLQREQQAKNDLNLATVELVASQMRLAGATEASIRAYEDWALKLSDVEIAARKAREQTEQNNAESAKRQQDMQQWVDMIGYGMTDVFTAMTEGSEEAEEALKRLIVQLLAAIATAAILKAFGLSGATAGAAQGMAFSQGGFRMFGKGGVVGGPTLFGFAGGVGLMGERGPEAIMPLGRDSTGKLGVRGGGTNVQVFNYSGADVSVERDRETLKIIVDRVRSTIAGDIARGGNPVATALERAYTVRR
jgi:hypothetical protein